MSTNSSSTFIPLRSSSIQGNVLNIFPSRDVESISITVETDQFRNKHGIEIEGTSIPNPIRTFEEIEIPYTLLSFLKKNKNCIQPTPIQMQSISCLLERRDCICLSPTGSGKTFSYLLPLCHFLWKNKRLSTNIQSSKVSPYCLIIVPTRELMNQVLSVTKELLDVLTTERSREYKSSYHPDQQDQAKSYHPHQQDQAKSYHHQQNRPEIFQQQYTNNIQNRWNQPNQVSYNASLQQQTHHHEWNKDIAKSSTSTSSAQLKVVGLCGGVPIKDNLLQVSSYTEVIVATPGRLIDMCDRGHISVDSLSYFVIDECDKMLDMGLEEQLRTLVAKVTINNTKIQTSLWSATLSDSLERLARSAVRNPIYISTGIKDTVPRNITQKVLFIHTYLKPENLLEVLRHTPYPPVIIFTSSKHKADELVELLQNEQFSAAAVHSDKTQQFRNEVVQSFRSDELDILVATDLISRGLDLPAVSHVINFDLPANIQDYVHRCGRTGRFGRSGLATSFLTLHCNIAHDLRDMLEATGNEIPPELNDPKMFGRKVISTEMGDSVA